MMDNEYVFNYDEVKRRFESVPPTTNSMSKKFKSTTYKTHFQPRTKSVMDKTSCNPIATNRSFRQEKPPTPATVTFEVHVIRVQQVMPQIQQGFYILPDCIQ